MSRVRDPRFDSSEDFCCCRCGVPIEPRIGGGWDVVWDSVTGRTPTVCPRRQQSTGGAHRLVPALMLPDDIELWLADELAPGVGRYPFAMAT